MLIDFIGSLFYTQDMDIQKPELEPTVEKLMKKNSRLPAVSLSILTGLIVLGLVSYGIYSWQQAKIDNLNSEYNKLKSIKLNNPEGTAQVDVKIPMSSYAVDSVPFTFAYPSSWALTTDQQLKDTSEVPEVYSFNLLSPGTVIDVNGVGFSYVKTGARINISTSKAYYTDPGDVFKGSLYSRYATDKKEMTIDGEKAVQYVFGYESDNAVHTDVVKEGKLYSITFSCEETDEKISNQYGVYVDLLKSFEFK